MNLVEIVPAFRRQLTQYIKSTDNDYILAAYLADAVDALNWRWNRDYVVTYASGSPDSYTVVPDLTAKDKFPVELMASIIYKGSNVSLAKFTDGDFAYDPTQAKTDPLFLDIETLNKILPITPRLFRASTTPLRGFSNGFNPESYHWLSTLGVAGAY